ncbi:hypothetical protein KC358_g87 [Hortaea werneckii]|nr:hypothetical protein KC358_g87 [Hortaea werneckii]
MLTIIHARRCLMTSLRVVEKADQRQCYANGEILARLASDEEPTLWPKQRPNRKTNIPFLPPLLQRRTRNPRTRNNQIELSARPFLINSRIRRHSQIPTGIYPSRPPAPFATPPLRFPLRHNPPNHLRQLIFRAPQQLLAVLPEPLRIEPQRPCFRVVGSSLHVPGDMVRGFFFALPARSCAEDDRVTAIAVLLERPQRFALQFLSKGRDVEVEGLEGGDEGRDPGEDLGVFGWGDEGFGGVEVDADPDRDGFGEGVRHGFAAAGGVDDDTSVEWEGRNG